MRRSSPRLALDRTLWRYLRLCHTLEIERTHSAPHQSALSPPLRNGTPSARAVRKTEDLRREIAPVAEEGRRRRDRR